MEVEVQHQRGSVCAIPLEEMRQQQRLQEEAAMQAKVWWVKCNLITATTIHVVMRGEYLKSGLSRKMLSLSLHTASEFSDFHNQSRVRCWTAAGTALMD